MSRHFQYLLSGALISIIGLSAAPFVSAQNEAPPRLPPLALRNAPPVALPAGAGQWPALPAGAAYPPAHSTATFGASKEIQNQRIAVDELQVKIQTGTLNAEEEDQAAAKLKEGIALLEDLELKPLEQQVTQILAAIEQRKTDRDKLIENRLKQIMDAPKVGEITWQIQTVEKQQDGSSIATVTLMRTEQRTRATPVTKMKLEKRKRKVNGGEQEYTVQVAETTTEDRIYILQVPAGRQEIPIPKGQNVNKTVKKFVDGLGDF